MAYFNPFYLDVPNAALRRDEQPIVLTRKAFRVLRYLVEHTGRLVTKDELWRVVWPGVTVTDALEAGALSAFGTTGQRAVTAAGAGMDLILCSARDVSQSEAATAALASALASGQLDPAAFNAAVNRVTALRAGLF